MLGHGLMVNHACLNTISATRRRARPLIVVQAGGFLPFLARRLPRGRSGTLQIQLRVSATDLRELGLSALPHEQSDEMDEAHSRCADVA